MNEKITNQIADMKKQTIGVEVEMNHIERSRAAKLAADFFGTGRYENTGTATAPGQPGMRTAESGNSKRMSASQDATARNAKW